MNVYPPNDYRAYLMHHGIKGMRWGVQNGPPYPLDSDTHSMVVSGKSVGKSKKFLSNKESDPDKELLRYALSLGVDVATLNPSGLAADIARAGQALKSSRRSNANRKARRSSNVDKETGYRLKSKAYSKKEDMEAVNPNYHNFSRGTKKNCMHCTTAYDMRRRGFEVTAEERSYGYNMSDGTKWYKDSKLVESVGVGKTFGERFKTGFKANLGANSFISKKVTSDLLKQGEGARGNLMMLWDSSGAGHSVVYEVENGKVILRDCQSNKVYKNPSSLLNKSVGVSYIRLDNVEPDYKAMKRDGVIR